MAPNDEFTPDSIDEQIEQLSQGIRQGHPPAPLARRQYHGPADRSDASLVQALRRIYRVPLSDADRTSLERTRQRIVNGRMDDRTRSFVSLGMTTITPQGQQEASSPMQWHVDQRKRSTFVRVLSSLAAVIIVGALVGSWALVTHFTMNQKTSQTKPTGITMKPGEPLSIIQMMDTTTGWAVTATNYHILRTTDAGASWKDVTPATGYPQGGAINLAPTAGATGYPQGVPLLYAGATDFLTAFIAWVAVLGHDGSIHVFHTTNAGQTWQSTTIHYGTVAIKQITFLDSQHGWILAAMGASTQAELVSILRTSDGGKTWVTISDGNYTPHPPPGTLPSGGTKSGLSFLTASTGWATGWWAAKDFFYETHDGGHTWQQQSLPGPLSVPVINAPLESEPPTFFTATDGVLPVRFTTPTSWGLDFYVTHDGGTSWQSTTPLSLSSSSPSSYPRAFFMRDQNHIWVAGGTLLYVTGDGGLHWTKITQGVRQGGAIHLAPTFTDLDFVSDKIGWATGSTGDNAAVLLKTVDGGHSWIQIHYQIML